MADLPASIVFLIAVVIFLFISSFYSASQSPAEPYVNYTKCERNPVRGIMKDIFAANGVLQDAAGA